MTLDEAFAEIPVELRETLDSMRKMIRNCEAMKTGPRAPGRSPGVLFFYLSIFNGRIPGLLIETPSGREGGFGGGPNTPIGYDSNGLPIFR